MNCFQAEIEAGHVIVDGELKPRGDLVLLAHGAGTGMDHDFMVAVAKGLADKGLCVVRFNFPYMQKRTEDGKRRPPDRAPKLLEFFGHVVMLATESGAGRIWLVGKSMGSRMAAILAGDEAYSGRVAGVVCLGYPFMPIKRKDVEVEPRLEPLQQAKVPVLVLQGERDSFGSFTQANGWQLGQNISIKPIPDGDHSFVPRKSSATTATANLVLAVDYCVEFFGERHA
ncbi:MAG: alpha/beta fold hydrolase [Shewanella sp.]|nr:alpha/beta fold hydrolase [Shewanella sp.]MCF1431891.1 alpha/beta fold hydrolase [Shewanella sp.]MCF1439561.1 alpha/beta fold hydrolase [Shewanella sp.]MCF1456439.1 alpha/beta fold hydrolase [Shewanella sp.]